MVYNYTKPRGPIAAMYNSPGPCYSLPSLTGQPNHDPRSIAVKAPAYPFGIKHGKFRDDCSPGPAYMVPAKTFRDGADGTPHYSLYARRSDIQAFKTPGPGAYSPEKSGPSASPLAPNYSFGTRHKHRRSDNTPAPNNYTIASAIGPTIQSGQRQAPMYSLRGRSKVGSFHEDLQKTPGAGAYNATDKSVTANKAPLYSMTGRNQMPGDSTQKPGPGAHSPEKVYMNKKLAPQFSFGIKHSQYTAPLIVDNLCD